MRHRLASLVDGLGAAGERRWPRGGALACPPQFAAALAALRADHGSAAPDGGAHADDDSRLAQMGRVFALGAFDLELLAVALSVELDPNFGLAYGILQGRDGPARPSVATALELCDVPMMSAAGRARLGPAAPLRRHRLLDLVGDTPMPGRELRPFDRVVAHVLGDDASEPDVDAMVVDSVAVDVAETGVLAEAIEGGERLCWVHAVPGTVGLSLAAGAFEALGVARLAVDLARRRADLALDQAVRLAAREAALLGRGLIVTGAESLCDDANVWVLRLLREAAVPVVAVASVPWQARWLDRLPTSVSAPPTSASLREALWREHVSDPPVGASAWSDLVGLRLTPEQIVLAGRHVDGAAPVAALLDAARRVGSSRAQAGGGKPSATFDDLVLPDSTLDSIKQLASWARQRDAVLAHNPRLVSGGKGRGVSTLFAGSPGTGKTLAAHVVADALNLDLYQVELPAVVDKYVGETEKNLQRVFHEAESLNAVLFFDEADSLFGARSEVRDARDRYANIEVAYLLQRMEQFDGIAILATNLRGNLDVAFSRRLQFIVHFPEPDEPIRRRLWLRHLSGFEPLDDGDPIDVDHLARTVEVAGGDIRNIVMAAAYAAFDEDSRIGMRHLVAAVDRELRKLGRRVPAKGVRAPAGS